MKRLFVFRHGKSDWHAPFDEDHDRPLADRGIQAAEAMGRFLSALGQQPGLVLTSSAVRAAETSRLAATAGAWECDLIVSEALYMAHPDTVLQLIREQGEGPESLLIAGHQPTLSALIGSFLGQAEVNFPTAAIARLDLPIDRWSAARFGQARLAWLVTPKLLSRGAD